MRFEPTSATTAAPSPSESGDITTVPLRLLKSMFHGTELWLISQNDLSDRIYFSVLAHSLYTRNSLDPQDTETWKYYYNLRFKQISSKNSGPASFRMQVLQNKKVYMEKYEIPLGWVRFEPTPATTAAPSPSESGDKTTATLRLLKINKFLGTVWCLISLNGPSDRAKWYFIFLPRSTCIIHQ